MLNMFKGFSDALKDMSKFIFFIQLFVAIICPGYLIVFLYKYSLFLDLDIIKLTLFSVSLSLPALFQNAVIYWIFFMISGLEKEFLKTNSTQNEAIKVAIANGSFLTIIQLYLPIVVSWLFKWNFRTFFFIQIGFMGLYIMLAVIFGVFIRKMRVDEKNKENQQTQNIVS